MPLNDVFPTALYAVYSNPLPGHEADLHQWYEDVHIPDSFDAGLFQSVRRYRSLDPADTPRPAGVPEECHSKFLTLWGCHYADTEAALSAVRPIAEGLRSKGRVQSFQEVVFQEFIFRHSVQQERSGRENRGLTTLHSRWSRADAIAPFEKWLDRPSGRGYVTPATSATSSQASARYGLEGPRARAVLLIEQHRPPDLGLLSSQPGARKGLPPFGAPIPIFESGSPAPSPKPTPEPPEEPGSPLAVWIEGWELIGARER